MRLLHAGVRYARTRGASSGGAGNGAPAEVRCAAKMRSAQTCICERCALRFARGELCPSCRSTRYVDLALPLRGARRALPTRTSLGPVRTSAPQRSRVRVHGRVHVAQPLVSPLGHLACAACRVVGQAPGGDVDDALVVERFEVLGDDGRRTVVHAEGAIVALRVEDAPRVVRVDAPLEAFLAARGLRPLDGAVRLAEVALREGDLVTIDGAPSRHTEARGYRGDEEVTALHHTLRAPLVVRAGK